MSFLLEFICDGKTLFKFNKAFDILRETLYYILFNEKENVTIQNNTFIRWVFNFSVNARA